MNKNDYFIVLLLWLVPDALLAWAYSNLTEGNNSEFWNAYVVLLLIGIFVSIKQTLTGALIYRLWGKKRITRSAIDTMSALNLPWVDDCKSAAEYLTTVCQDENTPLDSRVKVAELNGYLEGAKQQGFFMALRLNACWDEALTIHLARAPRPSMAQS